MSEEKIEVTHNRAADRFEIERDGQLAELPYRERGGQIVFLHTGVPKSLEGQGFGSALARAGLDYAREQGLAVQSRCPFISAYIEDHPDYKPLLAS